jgi:hypothetical protein
MSKWFCVTPRGVYDWSFKKIPKREDYLKGWSEFYIVNENENLHVGTVIRDGDRNWSCFSTRGHHLGVVYGLNSRFKAAQLLLKMGGFEL